MPLFVSTVFFAAHKPACLLQSDAASGLSDEEYGRPAKSKKQKQRERALLQQQTRDQEDYRSYGQDDDLEEEDDLEEDEAGPWPEESAGGLKLVDMNIARVTRETLYRIIDEPFVEKAIKDCFVRYMIGVHNGHPTYRICQVKGVIQGRQNYSLLGSKKGSRQRRTTQMLKLGIAGSVKECKIDKVSNSRFTQQELDKWRQGMRDQRMPTVTPQDCTRLHRRMKDVMNNHQYTHEEIMQRVSKKSKAAIATGRLNLSQARIKLVNEMATLRQGIEDATERLRQAEQGTPKFYLCEGEVYDLESKLKGLQKDEEALLRHVQHKDVKLIANDKLAAVNVKNQTKNVQVDGVDSRAMLREEFMGGNDDDGAMFRTTRTRLADLWRAGRKNNKAGFNQSGGANDAGFSNEDAEAGDYVLSAFKHEDGLKNGVKGGGKGKGVVFAYSNKGLKRPLNPDAPRKRAGISLVEYLERARQPQADSTFAAVVDEPEEKSDASITNPASVGGN